MADRQSSWLERAQTRALVAAEQRLGLEPKKAKVVFAAAIVLVLLLIGFAASSAMSGDSSGTVSVGAFDGSQSSASASSSASSNLFSDDGEDEDGGEESRGGDAGDDEESEESDEGGPSARTDESDEDDSEAEQFKPKQIKLMQDKDKTFMKFFTKHRKDSEIAAHFQALEDTYKDLKLMRTVNIGSTYEKKSILAYVIGKGKSGKGILVHATERGDEWLGNMGLAYFATRLLQKYALNAAVTKVVNQLKIYLVPVANPDGLGYCLSSSSKSHREWYMNRALNNDKKHGVDVSKDFEQFTQLETQALRAFAKSNSRDIHAFANIRCCRGSVSIPTPVLCSSSGEQKSVAEKIASSMGKLGNYRYTTQFSDSAQGTSAVWANQELGLGLSFVLDAHTVTSISTPADVKTADILPAAQNVTMGLMELAKYVVTDLTRAKTSLGGGGSKPCGSKGSSSLKAKRVSDDEDDEDNQRAEDDSEVDNDDPSSKAAEVEDDGVDHAQSFEHARSGPAVQATDEIEMSINHVRYQGVKQPIPGVEIPTDPESGDTFLYFAYGPDMLYDVILKAGLTSAWKVVNARLSGYTFDYTYHSNKKWKSGVADIVKYSHGVVYGVVWRLDKLHMQTLLTWQSASTPTSPLAKKLVTVQDAEGNSYNCITFYVVKKMKGEDILGKYHRFPPSRQYRNCVLKGAKSHHLPYDYVEHKLRSRLLSPLFTDKVGTTGHRNTIIGTVCDPMD